MLTALVGSGLPVVPFGFVGFPPRKQGERGRLLADLAGRRESLVFFESPRRLAALLSELATHFGGEREACVARELTKLHEEYARGSLGILSERFSRESADQLAQAAAGLLFVKLGQFAAHRGLAVRTETFDEV